MKNQPNRAKMARKILVVGGAGYVGSSVAIALRDRGHEITVIDDLSTGYAQQNISKDFHLFRVGDRSRLAPLLESHRFDAVFHFAAVALVEESVRNPQKYFENNVEQTRVLVEEMARTHQGPLVFSSSCAVFGDPQGQKISEDLPKNPMNPYGESKKVAEGLIREACVRGELSAVVLRYFNASGAEPLNRVGERHEPETHLIPLVFRAFQEGKPVFINGADYPTRDATCVRDYVHVADLARAHELAMEHAISQNAIKGTRGVFDDFNLGTESGYSVKEVIDACEKVIGQPIAREVRLRRAGDPPALVANSSKALRVLGFKTEKSLEDVITSAYRWEQIRLGDVTCKKVAFIDRDGTINHDSGYVRDPKDAPIIDGAVAGLRILQSAGYDLVVVSNQSGVGRGKITLAELAAVNADLSLRLKQKGVYLNSFELCHHRPEDACQCRKPSPYLLLNYAKSVGASLSDCVMIGDKFIDLKAGQNAGCRAVGLVRSGYGAETETLPEYLEMSRSHSNVVVGATLFEVALELVTVAD